MVSLFPQPRLEVEFDRCWNESDCRKVADVGMFSVFIEFSGDVRGPPGDGDEDFFDAQFRPFIKSSFGMSLSGSVSVSWRIGLLSGEGQFPLVPYTLWEWFENPGGPPGDTSVIHFVVDLSDVWCDDVVDPPYRDELSWQMWTDMLFPDMHLVTTDGEEVCCHRTVLCSASAVFKAMLTSEFKEASHAEVIVHEATRKGVRAFLEFVYTGALPDALDQEALGRILRLADMYDIAALGEACACKVLLQTDKHNIVESVCALFPYCLWNDKLAKWSGFLLNLIQSDQELLVPLLLKLPQNPILSNAMQASTLGTQHGSIASPVLSEEQEDDAVDPEMGAPTLKSDCLQHVDMQVLRFPLPPPGLDSCSSVAEACSSKVLHISLLCFNSWTKDFSDALRNSDLAKAMISTSVEIEPPWAKGAKVFVEGLRPEALEPILNVDSLRPWHVIVHTESEESIIESVNLAWRRGYFKAKRPRVRQARQLMVRPSSDKKACEVGSSRKGIDGNASRDNSDVILETTALNVSLDAAGTVHYPVPPAFSPRSIVTAPP